MGRLTRDPVIKKDENIQAAAYYTLAVSRRVHNNGKEETDFIHCVEFGENVEAVNNYCRKGMKLLVVGRIHTGNYIKDGQKVYKTEIIVEEHELIQELRNEKNRSKKILIE